MSHADPVTMTLFHSALRRDLTRARVLLDSPASLSQRRRRRLGRHLLWLMTQLRWHHEGEDHGLWPVLLEREPDSRAVLEGMEAEHAAIDEPILRLEEAARGLVAGRAQPRDVRLALEVLEGPLLDHLAHEESAGLPIVRRTLSHREWQEFERLEWIEGFTIADTLRFLRWICDGVNQQDVLRRGLGVPVWLQQVSLRPLSRTAGIPGVTVWAGTPAAGIGNSLDASLALPVAG